MIVTSDTSGMEALLLRIQEAKDALPGLLVEAAQRSGDAVVEQLSDAAPRGQGGGEPPAGDASGPLSESFYVDAERQADSAVAEVKTTQPQKLEYVVYGTGIYGKYGTRIVPLLRRALFWPDAEHPYGSVAGMRPNDFVSPVLDGVEILVDAEMQGAVDELAAILEGGG